MVSFKLQATDFRKFDFGVVGADVDTSGVTTTGMHVEQ